MKAYQLTFGNRESPRFCMVVYATDAMTANEQHQCLLLPCEKMDVVAVGVAS